MKLTHRCLKLKRGYAQLYLNLHCIRIFNMKPFTQYKVGADMCIYFKWSKSGFIFKNVVKVGIYLFQSWVSTSHFCLISAIVKILGTTPKTHLSCYQYSKLLKGGRVLKIFVQGTYMKRLTKKNSYMTDTTYKKKHI